MPLRIPMSAPKIIIKITEPNKANVIIKPADAVLSEQYRNEALAFRNQAAGFASQTQADAVQTALDRVQTGLDVIATGEDRVQTGEDRNQTGLDAQATAADRVQTNLDAIATVADRVQTGLDVIAANEAKDDAEAAADAVANNVDFTGAEDGDLLQRESGIYVPKSPTLVNKSLVPFLNSPLAGLIDLDNVFAWDSFNRADGALGTSDSGQAWNILSGNFSISNNSATSTTNGSIATINTGVGNICIRSTFIEGSAGFVGRALVIGKDINNYFELATTGNTLSIRKIIGGVLTTVATLQNLPDVNFNSSRRLNNQTYEFSIYRNASNSLMYLSGVLLNYPSILVFADVSTDLTLFSNDSDIGFAGIKRIAGGPTYQNVLITKLT